MLLSHSQWKVMVNPPSQNVRRCCWWLLLGGGTSQYVYIRTVTQIFIYEEVCIKKFIHIYEVYIYK